MLNSRQRAQLRALANGIETIVYVGKEDVTDNVITQMRDALKARELVKGAVQRGSMLTAREACEKLAEACGADPVQVIGSRFVLYKHNGQKRDAIRLVK